MSFDIDPIYVIYLFVALAAGLFVEGIYLLFFTARVVSQEHQPPPQAAGQTSPTARACWCSCAASAA